MIGLLQSRTLASSCRHGLRLSVMPDKVLDYRPAQSKTAPPSVVHIERRAGGGVIVRVAYPPGTFRDAVIASIVVCGALGLFPIFFLWFSWRSFPRGALVAFLPWYVFVGAAACILFAHVSRMAQSYTLQADSDGITIQRCRGRREWLERVPRERITNVRIGFGQAGRSGRSTAWLVIVVRPWYRMNRTLLHGLGGDHLARVADAVREGLGFEPVDWPSGRPRKAG